MNNFVDDFESTNLPEINLPSQSSSSVSTLICQVCKLPAHGMHFGVLSCRPCAAFYRRIIFLNLKYTCLKNDESCNVEGRGRNVCRECRFKRCVDAGMVTDNVQYNRDVQKQKKERKQKQVVKRGMKPRISKSPESPPSEESTSSEDVVLTMLPHGEPDLDPDPEMDAVLQDLKNLFVEYIPPKLVLQCARNQLERMNSALMLYRQNQRPVEHLNFIKKINFLTDSQTYYTRRCHKFSKYIRCIDFFDHLPEQDKLSVVKISFIIFDRLERCQMSARLFGETSFLEKKYAFSSYCACDLMNVEVETATAIQTEEADKYIKTAFMDNINMTCEDVIKPLFELQLTDMETTFMLAQVIMYNEEKSPPHLTKMFDELREGVSQDLHIYYIEQSIDNYTNRLLKIMTVVNNIKKVCLVRQRQIEMIRLFDVYKLSQKKTDLFCT